MQTLLRRNSQYGGKDLKLIIEKMVDMGDRQLEEANITYYAFSHESISYLFRNC